MASPDRRWLLAVLLGTGLAACGDRASDDAITRERYVDLYVRILRAASAAPDSTAAAESVRVILRDANVSADQLDAFGQRHADDPEYLSDVWGQIERRLREGPGPDSIGDGSATRAPRSQRPVG